MELLETSKRQEKSELKETEILSLDFPKVCIAEPKSKHITCIQECAIKNRNQILSDLRKEGALLYRDYDIESPNEAVALLKQLGFVDFGCCQNNLKLIVGTRNSKTLNTEPLSMFRCETTSQIEQANVHNEFCETEKTPDFVALYCFRPSVKGGEISLVNWRQLCLYVKQKHPEFLNKIQTEGIVEISVLSEHENPEHNFGKGWKHSFKVADKKEAQKAFKEKKYEFEWLQNNEVRLKRKRKSSEFYAILNEVLSLYRSCLHVKSNLQDCLTFGNGQNIPLDVLKDICESSKKYINEVQLQEKDLLLLDYNTIKYMHSPAEGPSQLRKIYVSFMKLEEIKESKKEIGHTKLFQILNSSYKMPLVGFGTWKIPTEEAEEVVYNAIKCGYRHIDCASVYKNEVQVGKGIRKAIKQKICERKDLFITSKLWNTNHRPEHVRPACERTLEDLGLEYLDLYLMHFPVSLKYIPPEQDRYPEWIYDTKSDKPYMIEEKVPVTETWKAMEDLITAGLVRNIGTSNFTVALLRELIYTCQIKPAVLQTQIHPELNERKLVRYARQEGIQITCYSSFGASSYKEIGFTKEGEQPIYENEKIKEIADKHNVTPHQVVLRWAVQQGLAIIPKSVKVERMKQNADVTEFSLDEEDMNEIEKLNKGRRYNDPGDFCQNACGVFYPLHE